MCVFCGSPEPLHLGWVPLAIGAYAYYKGKQAIRRTEDAERALRPTDSPILGGRGGEGLGRDEALGETRIRGEKGA